MNKYIKNILLMLLVLLILALSLLAKVAIIYFVMKHLSSELQSAMWWIIFLT